jgi:hypothetical protein
VRTGAVRDLPNFYGPASEDDDAFPVLMRVREAHAVLHGNNGEGCILQGSQIPSAYCEYASSLRADGAYLAAHGNGLLLLHDVRAARTVLAFGSARAVPNEDGGVPIFEIAGRYASQWVEPDAYEGKTSAGRATTLRGPTCATPLGIGVLPDRSARVVCATDGGRISILSADGRMLWESREPLAALHPFTFMMTANDGRVLFEGWDRSRSDVRYVVDVIHPSITTLMVGSGHAVAQFDDGSVELFGKQDLAVGALRCVDGDRLLPFATCRSRFEVRGRLVPLPGMRSVR